MKQSISETKKEIEIFPYLFIRYASGHHSEFDQLKFTNLDIYIEEFNQLGKRSGYLKSSLCDNLFELINHTPEIEDKQRLLNIKRIVFNARKMEDLPESLDKILPDEIRRQLLEYNELREQQFQTQTRWETAFQDRLQHSRRVLQKLTQSDLLQKGIRLSSKVLFTQLKSFINTPISKFRNRELKQEFSLLRYITRMYFKTSPFSTFTHIGLGSLSNDAATYQTKLNKDAILSFTRLNNGICNYLKVLLSAHPDINGHLLIKLNPTLKESDNHLNFLVNFNNLESFQRLPCSQLLSLIISLNQDTKQPYSLNQLTCTLEQHIDGNKTVIKAYIQKLIQTGLLEYDFQTSGISPVWDSEFVSYLSKIENPPPLLIKTIAELKSQRSFCELYSSADLSSRCEILNKMFDSLHRLFDLYLADMDLPAENHEAYKKEYLASFNEKEFQKKPYLIPAFTTEKLIYEDAFISDIACVSKDEVNAVINSVDELCDLLKPIDLLNIERSRITQFFVSTYKPVQEVKLLDFYNNYYLNIKKPQKELQETNTNSADKHQQDYSKTYTDWVNIFKYFLQPEIRVVDNEVHLSRDLLMNAKEVTKSENKFKVMSRGMFAQCFIKDDNLHAVINGVFQGMGRASGRFLHLFEAKVTSALQDYNKLYNDGCMLMELTDGSYFNANTHPPLLAYELKIPDGHNGLPPEQQIEVKDMLVCYDDQIEQVFLLHAITRQRIIPFDLCLQSLTNRSKLYQLLASFSPDQSVTFSPIQKAITEIISQQSDTLAKPDFYCYPRITYDERIIIKRKSWSVPVSFVPVKGSQQSDADYFMLVNQWQQSNGFPNQIFLYLKPNSSAKERETSDDYKPQYIRFDNPLLILLWSKLLTRAGEYIYFEEMLPDAAILKEQPVNETLIQWYCR